MLLTNSKKHTSEQISLGKAGELHVVQWLITQEYTILATNYHSRYGELDIIAKQGNILVCVEVKMRRTNYFSLSQVVTPSKQRKMILTAQYYRLIHKIYSLSIRFDVALLHGTQENFELEYIENAFCPPDSMNSFCL